MGPATYAYPNPHYQIIKQVDAIITFIMLHGEGISGVVFLTLYSGNLILLLYGYATRRIVFRSVYTLLLLHILLRIGAQSVGIALGSQSSIDPGILVAFFVLGAEGYFSLVLCTYRFLIRHHQIEYPTDGSWLEGHHGRPKVEEAKDKSGWLKWFERLKRALTARDEKGKRDPWVMSVIHWVLIAVSIARDSSATCVVGRGEKENNIDDLGQCRYRFRRSPKRKHSGRQSIRVKATYRQGLSYSWTSCFPCDQSVPRLFPLAERQARS